MFQPEHTAVAKLLHQRHCRAVLIACHHCHQELLLQLQTIVIITNVTWLNHLNWTCRACWDWTQIKNTWRVTKVVTCNARHSVLCRLTRLLCLLLHWLSLLALSVIVGVLHNLTSLSRTDAGVFQAPLFQVAEATEAAASAATAAQQAGSSQAASSSSALAGKGATDWSKLLNKRSNSGEGKSVETMWSNSLAVAAVSGGHRWRLFNLATAEQWSWQTSRYEHGKLEARIIEFLSEWLVTFLMPAKHVLDTRAPHLYFMFLKEYWFRELYLGLKVTASFDRSESYTRIIDGQVRCITPDFKPKDLQVAWNVQFITVFVPAWMIPPIYHSLRRESIKNTNSASAIGVKSVRPTWFEDIVTTRNSMNRCMALNW